MTLKTVYSDRFNVIDEVNGTRGYGGAFNASNFDRNMHLRPDDGDLSTLEFLDEGTIVEKLCKRFFSGEYYVSCNYIHYFIVVKAVNSENRYRAGRSALQHFFRLFAF